MRGHRSARELFETQIALQMWYHQGVSVTGEVTKKADGSMVIASDELKMVSR